MVKSREEFIVIDCLHGVSADTSVNINKLKSLPANRDVNIAITKLEEAIHRLKDAISVIEV